MAKTFSRSEADRLDVVLVLAVVLKRRAAEGVEPWRALIVRHAQCRDDAVLSHGGRVTWRADKGGEGV